MTANRLTTEHHHFTPRRQKERKRDDHRLSLNIVLNYVAPQISAVDAGSSEEGC